MNSLFSFVRALLLHLLLCLYLDPRIFLPSFSFLPIPWERGESERLGGWLAAGRGQAIAWYEIGEHTR